MKKFRFSLQLILGMMLISGVIFSQNETKNSDYVPSPGQAGKDVIWYPTPQSLVDVMINMAQLTPADFLIDLGSGDGRIVIAAAKRGIQAEGVEFNPDMVEFSKNNAAREGVADKTDFIKADFFEYDLSKATVITMFLLPEINRKMRPRLLELKPGTRIITNTFSMQDWPYDAMESIDDESTSWDTAYLWFVPAKVEGTWKSKEGKLTFSQKYQLVSGSIEKSGTTFTVSNGKLHGDSLRFTCNGITYSCKVDKNTLKGTAEKNGETMKWEAEKQN